MSFNSLDVYETAWLSTQEYRKLKDALVIAYANHRAALKALLGKIRPMVEAQICALSSVQQKVDVCHWAANAILAEDAPGESGISSSLVGDIAELCHVHFLQESANEEVSRRDTGLFSEEVFDKYWPAFNTETSEIRLMSQSPASFTFNDEECSVLFHTSSDCQGDYFGIDNELSQAYERILEGQDWSENTGSICVAIDEHGNVMPRYANGNPKNPVTNLMPDDYWPVFLQRCKEPNSRNESTMPASVLDDFIDDRPF